MAKLVFFIFVSLMRRIGNVANFMALTSAVLLLISSRDSRIASYLVTEMEKYTGIRGDIFYTVIFFIIFVYSMNSVIHYLYHKSFNFQVNRMIHRINHETSKTAEKKVLERNIKSACRGYLTGIDASVFVFFVLLLLFVLDPKVFIVSFLLGCCLGVSLVLGLRGFYKQSQNLRQARLEIQKQKRNLNGDLSASICETEQANIGDNTHKNKAMQTAVEILIQGIVLCVFIAGFHYFSENLELTGGASIFFILLIRQMIAAIKDISRGYIAYQSLSHAG